MAILLLIAMLIIWWRNRSASDPANVPCGMYGACQRRDDCNDAYCEGHPRNSGEGCKVIHFNRRSGSGERVDFSQE